MSFLFEIVDSARSEVDRGGVGVSLGGELPDVCDEDISNCNGV